MFQAWISMCVCNANFDWQFLNLMKQIVNFAYWYIEIVQCMDMFTEYQEWLLALKGQHRHDQQGMESGCCDWK